jgi:hypothetical protein
MGLEAVVYCNCYETGRHKTPPPPGIEIIISADGSIQCAHETIESAIALDARTHKRACDHEDCTLVHHYIGNLALVASLRGTLEQCAERFPIILSKVVYNGIHAGDYLSLEDVRAVQQELKSLPSIACGNGEDQEYLDTFREQMTELVESALALQKPIAF